MTFNFIRYMNRCLILLHIPAHYSADSFDMFVKQKPNEVPWPDRLKKMNRFIAEMLNDLNK